MDLTYNNDGVKRYHMSLTFAEAVFLEEILQRHLDDYVEELTKEKFKDPKTDQTKAYQFYSLHRRAATSLLQKSKEVIARSSS